MFVEFFRKNEVKKLIIRLNTDEQMVEGHVDSNGQPLTFKERNTTTYSKLTEILSNGRKKAGSPYTLRDTGRFHKSFNVYATRYSVTIEANGNLDDGGNIFEKFGLEILGLTDENFNIIIDLFIDAIIDKTIEEIL